jgi:hypothetical protein
MSALWTVDNGVVPYTYRAFRKASRRRLSAFASSSAVLASQSSSFPLSSVVKSPPSFFSCPLFCLIASLPSSFFRLSYFSFATSRFSSSLLFVFSSFPLGLLLFPFFYLVGIISSLLRIVLSRFIYSLRSFPASTAVFVTVTGPSSQRDFVKRDRVVGHSKVTAASSSVICSQ